MKAIKLFTMAALVTAVFASCSNDEDLWCEMHVELYPLRLL